MLTLLLCPCPAWVRAEERPAPAASEAELRVAVLTLRNATQMQSSEVEFLTGLVRRETAKLLPQRYLVMTQENIITLLPPGTRIEDCVGECEVDTGRAIGARYLITGEALRFGASLRISLRLHDTQSGRLINSEMAKGLEVEDLEGPTQEAVRELLTPLTEGVRAPTAERKVGGVSAQEAEAEWKRVAMSVLLGDGSHAERRAELDGYAAKYAGTGAPHLDVAEKWRQIMSKDRSDPAHPRSNVRFGLMLGGGLTWSITWFTFGIVGSVLSGIDYTPDQDFSRVWSPWIPVAGPFMRYANGQGDYTYWKMLYIFCGVLQAGGFLTYLAGHIVSPGEPPPEVLREAGLEKLIEPQSVQLQLMPFIEPVGGSSVGTSKGLSLVGRF